MKLFKNQSFLRLCCVVLAVSWSAQELSARGFRGGGRGGGGRGGGRSFGGGAGRSAPRRTPTMNRRPTSNYTRRQPTTRPATGNRRPTTRPSTGNRRPTTRPNNRPTTRPARPTTRPNQKQLNNFLNPKRPGASTRPAGGNRAVNNFLNQRPGAGNRPNQLNAKRSPGDRQNNRIDNRQQNKGDRTDNRQNRRDNMQNHRANRTDNRGQRSQNRQQRRDQVRDQFRDHHPRFDFWHSHPNWARWRWNRPYRWATWGLITGWFPWGWNTPVQYNYGVNVYYEGDTVYYGDEAVASASEYANQAAAIVESAPKVDDAVEWMPLGVFALTQDDEKSGAAPSLFLQLAVNKQGIIAGTFQNIDTNKSQSIEGMVDEKTQRSAWTFTGKKWPIVETGISNLTKDTVPVLIHFENGTTQQWLLVRVEEPKEGQQKKQSE